MSNDCATLLRPHARQADAPRAARLAALCGAVLLAMASSATAQDLPSTGPDVRLNGFGTLGVVDVLPHDDWGFRREVDQTVHHDQRLRADVDSRLGLQASWRLDPRLEFTGQLLCSSRVPTSASGTASPSNGPSRPGVRRPEWEIRGGRTSPDLFLLADVRNVGFAYPWKNAAQRRILQLDARFRPWTAWTSRAQWQPGRGPRCAPRSSRRPHERHAGQHAPTTATRMATCARCGRRRWRSIRTA